jgi:putative intracellular protease/amidase/YHS domain-containing protein
MKRRTFIKDASVLGFLAGSSFAIAGSVPTGRDAASAGNPLRPPAKGGIPVAFLVSDGAVVIDFAGPWEVFQDAAVAGRPDGAFSLYTVAETSRVIRASGGLRITPDYTFATAPAPKVIVIPAQNDATDAVKEWIRASSKNADVTMSVCTGAFLLASTGLLAGRSATTHHTGYKTLAIAYPDVHVRRGARFVEDGNIASSGGLTSGIDLALRVVERYFGREVARKTAYGMEYQGLGWLSPDSNAVYAAVPMSGSNSTCPVCDMDIDPATAVNSAYKGKTYYFCMQSHKDLFDKTPNLYLASAQETARGAL